MPDHARVRGFPAPGVDEAAARVLSTLMPGADAIATPADVELVSNWVVAALIRRGFAEVDASDAVSEVFLEIAEKGVGDVADDDPSAGGARPKPQPIRNPKAYFFWLARNRTIDALRRQRRVESLSAWTDADGRSLGENLPARDDALAKMFEQQATASSIVEAKRLAAKAHDHLAIRVVDAWLRMAEATGEPPSSRDLEPVLRASHTSVLKAIRRFRGYLEQTWSSP